MYHGIPDENVQLKFLSWWISATFWQSEIVSINFSTCNMRSCETLWIFDASFRIFSFISYNSEMSIDRENPIYLHSLFIMPWHRANPSIIIIEVLLSNHHKVHHMNWVLQRCWLLVNAIHWYALVVKLIFQFSIERKQWHRVREGECAKIHIERLRWFGLCRRIDKAPLNGIQRHRAI